MTLDKAYGPLINGVFELDGVDIHPVTSPSTGEILAELHYCNERDVERAVLAAEAAFPAWKEWRKSMRWMWAAASAKCVVIIKRRSDIIAISPR